MAYQLTGIAISNAPAVYGEPPNCLDLEWDFGGGGFVRNQNQPISSLIGSGTVCTMKPNNNTSVFPASTVEEQILYEMQNPVQINCQGCCPKGYYCPETWLNPEPGISIIECPIGHFCPDGVVKPIKCFFLQVCDSPGLASPNENMSALAVFGFLLLLFGFIPMVSEFIRLRVRAGYRSKQTEAEASYERRQTLRVTTVENIYTQENVILNWMAVANEKAGVSVYNLKPSIYLKMKLWAARARQSVQVRNINCKIFTSGVGANRSQALLTFRNICVSTKETSFGDDGIMHEKKHFYLNHATGFIRPSKVTAIMGPSGCGKSTLITALTNRVPANMFDGEIFLNNDRIEPYQLNKVCGYVPQEDVMNSDLTVKENLYYQCRLRHNPSSSLASSKLRRKMVDEVIRNMGLHKVRHAIIGGGSKRGLSGGQKKRVNIAMELMHDPKILFMDEPTSGLDASMSFKFLQFMKQFSITTGTAVAMVIHQPNKKCFDVFDDVIMLQPSEEGGRLVFNGPIPNAIKYFNKICQRKILPHENAADAFVDLLSDGCPMYHYLIDKKIEVKGLLSYSDLYDEELILTGELWKGATWSGSNLDAVPLHMFGKILSRDEKKAIAKRYRRAKPSWFSVAFTCALMFLNTQLNNMWSIILTDFSVTFIVLILSIMGLGTEQLMFVINMLIGLVAGLYGVSIFRDIDLLNRYRNSGISNSATFLGTIVASIPRMLFQNAVFNVPYKNINVPLIKGEYLIAITLLGQVTAYMVGIILCVALDSKSADVYSVILTLLFWTFSGMAPVARSLNNTFFGRTGMWLSYCRWMFGSEMVLNAVSRAPCGASQHGLALKEMGLLPQKYIQFSNKTQDICIRNTTSDSTTGTLLYVYVNGTSTYLAPELVDGWSEYYRCATQGVILFAIITFLAMAALSQRQFLRLSLAKAEITLHNFMEDLKSLEEFNFGFTVTDKIKTADHTANRETGIEEVMDEIEDDGEVYEMNLKSNRAEVEVKEAIEELSRERRSRTVKKLLNMTASETLSDSIPAETAQESAPHSSVDTRAKVFDSGGKDDVTAMHWKV